VDNLALVLQCAHAPPGWCRSADCALSANVRACATVGVRWREPVLRRRLLLGAWPTTCGVIRTLRDRRDYCPGVASTRWWPVIFYVAGLSCAVGRAYSRYS